LKHYEKFYDRQSEAKNNLLYFKEIICSDLKKFSDEHLNKILEDREEAIIKDNQVCYPWDHEYFIKPEDYNEIWVRFRCNRVKSNNRTKVQGGCTANTEYKNWTLKYIFRRNQLHRWKEFDTATRKLLDQFYVDSN